MLKRKVTPRSSTYNSATPTVRFSHGKSEEKKKIYSFLCCSVLTLCLSLSQSWYLVSLVKSLNTNCHRGQREISLRFELLEERMHLTDSWEFPWRLWIFCQRGIADVAHFPFLLQPCSLHLWNYSSTGLYGFKSQTVGQQIQMIHKCSSQLILWGRSH